MTVEARANHQHATRLQLLDLRKADSQLTIPVKVAEVLLEPEERLLAIMRWIDESIPANERWSPVFERYLEQIADRVRGFGGDPETIAPSPSGSLPRDGKHRRLHEHAFTGKISGISTTDLAILRASRRLHRKGTSTDSGAKSMKSKYWCVSPG